MPLKAELITVMQLRLEKGIVLGERKCLSVPSPCPFTPMDKSSPSPKPSEGWWQVAQETSLLPDRIGSKNNSLPNTIFWGDWGLFAGVATESGKALKWTFMIESQLVPGTVSGLVLGI